MPRAYLAYRRNYIKYKVYVKSGRYSEYYLRGSTYNI